MKRTRPVKIEWQRKCPLDSTPPPTMTASMESWIDTRSFEELTDASEPTGTYQWVVEMILRDATIFRGTQTLYDDSLFEMEKELKESLENEKEYEKRIQESETRRDEKEKYVLAFEKLVEKNAPQPCEVQSVEDHKMHTVRVQKLATHKKSFLTMDKNHKLMILDSLDLKDRIVELQEMLPLLKEVQRWTEKRFVSLHRLARAYTVDKDLARLQKGVHWVCEYGEKMVNRAIREKPDFFEKLMPVNTDTRRIPISSSSSSWDLVAE